MKTNTHRNEVFLSYLSNDNSYYTLDDNIGNRKTAQELAEESTYEVNNLNQYGSITQGETAFTPTFDDDGNQTLIETSTGIWSVSYNADNRPISFTQSQGDQNTIIECGYDYIGRRYMKKVTSNGTVSLHQRYIYRSYLQIACVDLSRSGHPAPWYITWDPTEPVATRPLAIQKNATWYTYSHDLTKNVTELYQSDGLIATSYDYSPYGAATAVGTEQPLQWSSEYHDAELALTYYNYRHYNPTDGRWINRDTIEEEGGLNLYSFVQNRPITQFDLLGLQAIDSLSNGVIQGLAAGKIAEVALLLGFATAADLIADLLKKGFKLKCKACNPPVGSWRQQCHTDHKHDGCCPHYHVFLVNQSPVAAGCRCFDKRGTVENNPQYPPYKGRPTGGGISITK